VDPEDGRVIQPVAVQRMAAALGGLWSSTVGDGTPAADMPQRRPGGAGSAGEGAACAEYRCASWRYPISEACHGGPAYPERWETTEAPFYFMSSCSREPSTGAHGFTDLQRAKLLR